MSPALVDSFSPAFDVLRPSIQHYPAVFNSPHSGNIYPPGLAAMTRLDPVTLRKSEDCFVDELFSAMPAMGCPLLKARFPRVYLDVNREPYELDPAMFDRPLPPFVNTSSLRVAGGLGTIPRIVSENETIYACAINWDDAADRIEKVYHPYHQTLSSLMTDTSDKFGYAILVDCHSMPSSAARLSTARRHAGTDIVIGDRYGSSCDLSISQTLEVLFRSAGLSVVHNKPYAGGFITQSYGQPDNGIHALQIEINRALYMNERTLEKGANFVELQHLLNDVLELFLSGLPDLLTPQQVAAE